MDFELFLDMLSVDSTTGREGEFAQMLAERLCTDGCTVERYPVTTMADDTFPGCRLPENLFFSWGKPEVVFCTHLDTVPPYIEPSVVRSSDGSIVKFCGRGTCDAKGQIFSMYQACRKLASEGLRGFGLLLLAGEETGSFGAKCFRESHPGAKWVIVGEPTDNNLTSASKGTKSFGLTFAGKSAHSGYPQMGRSAVLMFNDFVNELRRTEFPKDDLLGETTWNIGRLESSNPQNILSDRLTCRLYFRTTFASDHFVVEMMEHYAESWGNALEIKPFGGDTPMRYITFDNFPTAPVAFGSDAPQLTNFPNRILSGPGSILVAHTSDEYVSVSELDTAVSNYVRLYHAIMAEE